MKDPNNRLEALTICLEGTESANYKVGRDSYRTATSEIYSKTLFESSDRFSMSEGTLEIEIPPDTMCSFEGFNNKIIWGLRFQGKIRRWPDLDTTFPIVVLPKAVV